MMIDLVVGAVVALLALTVLNRVTGRLPGGAAVFLALIVVVSAATIRARRRERVQQ